MGGDFKHLHRSGGGLAFLFHVAFAAFHGTALSKTQAGLSER